MSLCHSVYLRFFGQLKDFLSPHRKGRRLAYTIKGCPSVKDTIEAIGVPHTTVDVIRVNGHNRDFGYQLKEGDRVDVYPPGDVSKKLLLHLVSPPVKLHFVVDSHLGKLARSLRLLGFDALYENAFADQCIVALAVSQKRIVLTRDKGLLKHKRLRWGYWVRHIDAESQILEVMRRYNLARHIKPFSRCLECNGPIEVVTKARVFEQLPPKVKQYYRRFYRCQRCSHVYWKGSHYKKLEQFVRRVKIQQPNV